MSKINSFLPVVMTSINAGTLDAGTYKAINSSGLEKACRLIRILNRSKLDVLVSFDGTTDHDYLIHGTELEIYPPYVIDFTGFRKSSKVYVKSAASVGAIYLMAYS